MEIKAFVKNLKTSEESLITAVDDERFYNAQVYRNYAYICSFDKIFIYNLADMTSIQKVGVIEKGYDATAGYDHYISGDYLFVGDDAQEMVYVYYLKIRKWILETLSLNKVLAIKL